MPPVSHVDNFPAIRRISWFLGITRWAHLVVPGKAHTGTMYTAA
jgi:hypothetical protein